MMEKVTRLLALLLCLTLTVSAATRKKKAAPAATGPVSILSDVSVVDVVTGTITPHQDVVMRGEKIAEIRRTATPGKTIRYAIPGLWDMHVHLWNRESQFAQYLANGVTGLRNMGADAVRVKRWQAEPGSPRIYTTMAPIATKSSGAQLPVTVVQTPADAKRAFDIAYNGQMNFINILDMPANAFETLAEASRHDGVPFAGHLPDSVSAVTAAQDRMSSMEHLFGVGLACSSKEEELRNRKLLLGDKPDPAEAAKLDAEIISSYDPFTAKQVFGEFKRFNLRQTPTLTFWERRKDAKAQYDFALFLTGEMSKAGVPFLAGTDSGEAGTTPGLELHRELELLVKAGLSPAQALRSATLEPAAMMRKAGELGQLKKGFAADVVVLDANPLADIRNTRKIRQVILRGKTVAGRAAGGASGKGR